MAPFLAPFGIESAKLGVEFSGALVVDEPEGPDERTGGSGLCVSFLLLVAHEIMGINAGSSS